MAPNYVDTNSLKLQAQSDVAMVFSPQGRLKVLYQPLGEPVKITPPSSSRNLENKEILPCVPTPRNGCQAQGFVVELKKIM
jgi:hypothetical protein